MVFSFSRQTEQNTPRCTPRGKYQDSTESSSDSNVQLTANLGGPVLASDCTHRSNEPQEPARVCILTGGLRGKRHWEFRDIMFWLVLKRRSFVSNSSVFSNYYTLVIHSFSVLGAGMRRRTTIKRSVGTVLASLCTMTSQQYSR